MRLYVASIAAIWLLMSLVAACTGSGGTTGTTALFATTSGDFYALPYPNDLRRHEDFALDLSQFPTHSLIVESYRSVAEKLDGFGLNSAIYARFDGALDPMSLPDPAGSMAPSASVYLVNIDTRSPGYGLRTPIVVHFRPEAGQTIGANHLVARPYPGFGLDEGTRYALVITRRVRDPGGAAINPSSEWLELVGDANARSTYASLVDWLGRTGTDTLDDLACAAVFTTQHITQVGPALRKGVFAAPAPVVTGVAVVATPGTSFKLFTGGYEAPNFQAGAVPYHDPPSGEIAIGSDGAAVVQRTETMRFAMTVPLGPTPASGFPICIYAHGTGGDYRSFVEDGTGGRLAAQGIATISTDQVLHGPRNPGGNPEIDFFNFGNPYGARDNALQGTADAFAQLRLAQGLSIVDGNRIIRVDPTRVFFFGHSQGGLTGPGFVAFEPSLTGAVFSGTGGLLYLNLLYKTMPFDIPSLVATFLRDDPVDEDNPSLALLQMWFERADGANYAPLMVRKPAPGLRPRNIFQTEGFSDSYAPNQGIEAFATALGGDLVMLPDEQAVAGLTLRDRSVLPTPITGNLDGVTAVLAQYKQLAGSDGHFVVFEVPSAERQAAQFLGSLAATGTATVVP